VWKMEADCEISGSRAGKCEDCCLRFEVLTPEEIKITLRPEVFTTVNMKITVLRNVALFSVVNVY
jgi:hypothetical protein